VTAETICVGPLTVHAQFRNGSLCALDLPDTAPTELDADTLGAMLARLSEFPLSFDGAPPFHRAVWEAMRTIPCGSALTYQEVAELAGSPRAVRAVGQACGANPLPLIVPCHRVLAGSGAGGFRLGLAWKLKLLELETELALRQPGNS
jgi:O-6-methylguanine DNA methyltransferase